MNKWQIICPIVLIAVVAVALGIRHGRDNYNYFVRARSREIATELIAKTNSSLVQVMPDLRARLETLLQSPAGIESVELGDVNADNGLATSHIVLSNSVKVRLGIRLKQSSTDTWEILGYWIPN